MTDLHTHILCGVDDGAKTPAESLLLLQMEQQSGVDTVVLTPHFYRDAMTPEEFFSRRETAYDTLRSFLEPVQEPLPRMLLGAEVAWRPNMAEWDGLERFCIQRTRNMLLELPFGKWDVELCNQLHDLMNHTGITPILAHLERYLGTQDKMQVKEILSLGVPVQISSTPLLHFFSRGGSLKALKKSWAHVVASDCHDPVNRRPDLGEAMQVIEKRLGENQAKRIEAFADGLCS